jgi:guanylate kinase
MQELVEPTYPYEVLKQPRPLLVILSGPSGVGKDTVMAGLREAGVPFYQVVTAATRPRRQDEQDGLDYHFVSKERFAEMIERKDLLEHAVVYGDYKGIPKDEVRKGLDSGLDVVLRIDVQGAATIRRMVRQAVAIFLVASSEEEMVKRLRERKTEEAGTLALRIATAREELQRLEEFKYVVVNREDCLDETVRQVISIMTAERCRVDWEPVQL